MSINDECLDLIYSLSNLGSNLITDVIMAEHFGLQEHNFSEQDLKNLKKIHDRFCDAYNDIPDFEFITRFNKPIEYD